MKKMLKSQRIDAAVAGEAMDRIPAGFWRHFYQHEDSARGLADAMLRFQENYDWDFMKVNPRGSYHHEDWGASYKFFKDGYTAPERLDYPVKRLMDIEKIHPLKTLKSRVLMEHIDALHYIKKNLAKDVYMLMTVFTPLSIAADMALSRDLFKEYMLEDEKLVLSMIEAVTETFEEFVTEILNVGIDGIFFATTHWGSYNKLTDEEFDKFSRPFDLRILKIVKDCSFNVLHVCKSRNMLEKLADYPVHAFSWDATNPENASLCEGREITGKCVIGGIDGKNLLKGSKDSCTRQALESMKKTCGKGWILGADCTFDPSTPVENLKALREWIEYTPVG